MKPIIAAVVLFASCLCGCVTMHTAASAYEAVAPILVEQGIKAANKQLDKMVKSGELKEADGEKAKQALKQLASELSK